MVSVTRAADGACTTEYDGQDRYEDGKQDNLPDIKAEPEDVCFMIIFT